MRILYAKTFGIGNAVMAIPAIRALQSMGHHVDMLIGSSDDDFGAGAVLTGVVSEKGQIFVDSVTPGVNHDVTILAIPFDGRWQNGVHFRAAQVMDGRTRPDPLTTGLVSWKKHEIEYQMDNVRELGYVGDVPSMSFVQSWQRDYSRLYVGVGYKKDVAGFWKVKHWGNDNYTKLIKMLLDDDRKLEVVSSGDPADLKLSLWPILNGVASPRFKITGSAVLIRSFDAVASCGTYVGNDTGMMHVAASCGLETLGLFFMENSIVKSRPWGPNGHAIDGVGRTVTPEEVFAKVKEIRG